MIFENMLVFILTCFLSRLLQEGCNFFCEWAMISRRWDYTKTWLLNNTNESRQFLGAKQLTIFGNDWHSWFHIMERKIENYTVALSRMVIHKGASLLEIIEKSPKQILSKVHSWRPYKEWAKKRYFTKSIFIFRK